MSGAPGGVGDTVVSRPSARIELIVAGVLGAAIVILPLVWTEAFPLTATPMFARPLERRTYYTLRDAQGRRLDNDQFGIRTNLNWYLEDFYAVKYPHNFLTSPQDLPDDNVLCPQLQRRAEQQHAEFPLTLTCDILGPLDARRIGLLETREWLIHNTSWTRLR